MSIELPLTQKIQQFSHNSDSEDLERNKTGKSEKAGLIKEDFEVKTDPIFQNIIINEIEKKEVSLKCWLIKYS